MSNFESLLLLLKEYKAGYTRLEEEELFAKMSAFMKIECFSYEEYQYLLGLMSEGNLNEKLE